MPGWRGGIRGAAYVLHREMRQWSASLCQPTVFSDAWVHLRQIRWIFLKNKTVVPPRNLPPYSTSSMSDGQF